MAKNQKTQRGEVIEALPESRFIVRLEDDSEVRCYLAGKMNINFIRVLIGDKVDVVLSPQGDLGRIVRRID